ncbi:MAG TPA: substrate-binding domain-containing protein, partial [Methanoregulaceae archaeon]|nr:substrate-binding domain-containing protein [Methanoregulaceae archaeon]
MNSLKSSYLPVLVLSLILVAILSAGCTSPTTTPVTPTAAITQAPVTNATTTPATQAPRSTNSLLIATTTSLYDTGLLNRIQDIYQNETGVTLKITSQGTGQAIQLAQRGDADLLLVHSPSQEQTFIDNGYGINQRCFAYNYFVIVGPASDPAKIANMTPTAALTQIRALGLNGTPGVYFASRGDQSGTNTAEINLWTKAGFNYTNNISNSGPWYLSIGKGMGDTLTFANQKGAYTLSDEGTFLAYKSKLNLTILIQNNSQLLNRYSAIAVNPAKNPAVNVVQADRFINWLLSPEGRTVVGTYG